MRRLAAIGPPAHALVALSVVLASVAFYSWFVAGTTVEYGRARYFTLFDDAMVSMKYARNLADGAGLVWNAGGERVEGYTNLLWTLWMAVLHTVGIPEAKIGLAVAATGIVILVATALVAHRIVVEMGGSALAAVIALASVASFFPLLYWTLRGLEVGLVALLTTTGILLALRARDRGVIALAAVVTLAVLTRDDAAIPSVVIAAYAVVASPRDRRWRRSLLLSAALAGTVVLHTVFRLWYYGEPLPNTYHLKLGGIDLVTRLTRGLETLAEVGSLTLFVPAAMAVALFVSPARSRYRGASLLAGVFVVTCAYSVYVGGDAWEWTQFANRFVTPGAVCLLMLGALFIDAVRSQPALRAGAFAAVLIAGGCTLLVLTDVDFLADGTPPVGLRVVAFGLMALAVICALHGRWARGHGRTAMAAALGVLVIAAVNGRPYHTWWSVGAPYKDADRNMTRFGLLLRDSTPPGTTIAVTWAGAIPYFSHRRGVDLLGKSDARIAGMEPKSGRFLPGHNKWDYAYSIGHLRPDIVAQLFSRAPSISTQLRAWDYVPVAGDAWVRRDARGIDRRRLARFLATEYGARRG